MNINTVDKEELGWAGLGWAGAIVSTGRRRGGTFVPPHPDTGVNTGLT